MGTPTAAQGAATPQTSRIDPAAGGGGRIASLLFGLAAAWTAAGSLGLVGHTLRHGMSLTLLGACLAAGLSSLRQAFSWRRGIVLASTVLLATLLSSSSQAPLSIMASVLVLACVASLKPASEQGRFLICATSVFVLVLYRFALTTFPSFWLWMDRVAATVTFVAGFVSRQQLQ